MRGEFEAYGIEMVALSPDTVAEARRMKRSHGLGMKLLGDAELDVIDRYGLRHEKALGAPRDGKVLRPLAIPTTILIDREGVVRWIDQTDDYRVRSDPARVLAVVRATFEAD